MSKQVQQKMKRIFFIEDDLSLIKGMSFALRNQGYEVQTARTCLEAEKLWNSESCDLVILDVSLPDGSGFDLCGKIRAVSKVPILFLTAADEETDITMGLDIGGDDYITKPFKMCIRDRNRICGRQRSVCRHPPSQGQAGGRALKTGFH